MAEKKEKRYVSDNAQLMAEWDWEKNNSFGVVPNEITLGSTKKAWWTCLECGHSWEAVVNNRSNGRGCPKCAKINRIMTFNRSKICRHGSLATESPNLAKQWHPTKNGELTPQDVTKNSGQKVWWKCDNGHEWQATIDNRNKSQGCPYCSNKAVLTGYNDLQTINPTLAAEWHYEKNGELTPADVLPGSGTKVWWKCIHGHEWQAAIYSRNTGSECPYCTGKDVIVGYNDLQTVNPTLAAEWHYERNGELTPADMLPGSGIKVWWKCSKGHEWQTSIASRSRGAGCPYCSNKAVLIGYNDLQTVNPTLAAEWHYERNGELTPTDVLPGSDIKVWWKCSKGHEWQARIANRIRGNSCPICNKEKQTSFPEYALVFYLRQHGLDVIHSYKEKGFELDIYIPSQKIAIEYDGYYWHKDKTSEDIEKNKQCVKEGIKLYRMREGLPPLKDSSIDYIVQRHQKDLSKKMEVVLSEIIGVGVIVDLKRDSIAIENLREFTEKENSILLVNPEIASEWHFKKNGDLIPESYTANSHKKVWWKCSKGHEWQTSIASRSRGAGCPYCSNKAVLIGYNDLQTVNPTLAAEWHYERNGELTPADVLPGSGMKVWWKCSKGHEWQAIIGNRSKGNGCPYCSGQKAVIGTNDLQTVNPTLAKEWNYKKNNGLTPTDVLPNSHKKVWWKCDNGHEWQATIDNRNKSQGCPYCSNKAVLIGYNDLQTINPTLAAEWNCEQNGNIKPENVNANSHKKVWWKCSMGHEWQAAIYSRNNGHGCPKCASKRRWDARKKQNRE